MTSYVLGLDDGHNATACLLADGVVVACASEERFSRIKNQNGYPRKAIDFCLSFAGIEPLDLERVAFGWINLGMSPYSYRHYEYSGYSGLRNLAGNIRIWNFFRPFAEKLYDTALWFLGREYQVIRQATAVEHLGLEPSRVMFVDHHLSHALSALYCSGVPADGLDALVFTNDGRGENICATVSLFKNGSFRPVAKTYYTNSLGALYEQATEYLGLQPFKDEHKVMGLAGYLPESKSDEVYGCLRPLISVTDELTMRSRISRYSYGAFMRKKLSRARFDQVAAGVQRVAQSVLSDWVTKAVSKFRIGTITAAGGTFQNVKANMIIAERREVDHFFVMPSPGDETTAVGAAIAACIDLEPSVRIEPIKDLYWGPAIKEDEARQLVEALPGTKFSVARVPNIDGVVSEILASGKPVAVCRGRMEFGSRALGNRSILADASNPRVIQLINRAIKSRDWWMPFSPVIMRGHESEYVASPDPRKTNDQYMIFSYRSTAKARDDLAAAMHPFDMTIRPQVIDASWNIDYFRVVAEFSARTGRGGLLNTSFNIHDEPIVCTAANALRTFTVSGLEALVLADYLVQKNPAR